MDDISDLTTTPTPQSPPPLLGFLAFANAAGLKRRFPSPTPPPPDPQSDVSFKECLKNHAACIGGHALDGCCLFLPTPSFSPLSDPISLLCSACGCHRNFHRPDPDTPSLPPPPPSPTPKKRTLRARRIKNKKIKKPPTPATPSPAVSPAVSPESGGGGKRFRTRFSKHQKEEMYQFAERVGWKLMNVDKQEVDGFCEELGVDKDVLRIWFNNNKHTFGRVRKRSLIHSAGDGDAPVSRPRGRRPRFQRVSLGSPPASPPASSG